MKLEFGLCALKGKVHAVWVSFKVPLKNPTGHIDVYAIKRETGKK
jgi:hypothetical protein